MGPLSAMQCPVGWSLYPRGKPEHPVECGHGIEPAVEAKCEFVEAGLQMLWVYAVVGAKCPRI